LWAGVALTDLTPQCRGAKKDGSYQVSTGIAGVSYALVGQLFQGEAGVVQIEFRVPREHEAAAVGWLREWRGALELSR
jgi:hypothetical protein